MQYVSPLLNDLTEKIFYFSYFAKDGQQYRMIEIYIKKLQVLTKDNLKKYFGKHIKQITLIIYMNSKNS